MLHTLSLSQLKNAAFTLRPAPVLRPFGGSFVVADPSLLLPAETPDGKWHLFFHTTFGVCEAVSDDGIAFTKGKRLFSRAMRPNVNCIDGRYVLYFERTRPLVMNALHLVGAAKWHSEIYAAESRDLTTWSAPKPVLVHTRRYEESARGVSLSNPFLLRAGGVNRLYYSCGLTFIRDCGFCEPTYVSCAESDALLSGFRAAPAPLLSPDENDPYLNLCAGCLKVYRLSDCYIGIQNGIFEKDGKSASAILLLSSEDGLRFRFEKTLVAPRGDGGWMSQFVYASHLVCFDGVLRLYFNARNVANPLIGRECIGFAQAQIGR
ncbi:MAG: glycosyl hydrolase family 43 [Clostridia bacterium]|nr:glycosyl hydrolase family 43 [Clostridia bacterium]